MQMGKYHSFDVKYIKNIISFQGGGAESEHWRRDSSLPQHDVAPDVPHDDDDANVPHWSAAGGLRPAPDEDGAGKSSRYCPPETGDSQTGHYVQLPSPGDGAEVSS